MHYNKAMHGFAIESVPLGADRSTADAAVHAARPFLDRLWGEYTNAAPSAGARVADAAVLLSAGDAAMAGRVAAALGLSREQARGPTLGQSPRGGLRHLRALRYLHPPCFSQGDFTVYIAEPRFIAALFASPPPVGGVVWGAARRAREHVRCAPSFCAALPCFCRGKDSGISHAVAYLAS